MTVIDDKVWSVESNTRLNNLVRFDPIDGKSPDVADPHRIRQASPTRDGNIAMAMSGLNMVGAI